MRSQGNPSPGGDGFGDSFFSVSHKGSQFAVHGSGFGFAVNGWAVCGHRKQLRTENREQLTVNLIR